MNKYLDLVLAQYVLTMSWIKMTGLTAIIHRTFDKRVKHAYKRLSEIFTFGDRVFIYGSLFTFSLIICVEHHLSGFSRGAYQARTLAAMIHTVFV